MIINILIYFSLFLSILPSTRSDVDVYNNSSKLIDSFDDQPARFGPSLPAVGLQGYITTTNPQNACQKLSPPPNIPIGGYRWIALIPRTTGADSCEFIVKIQNAQEANFSAVIIYNYEDTLLPMGSSAKNVHIPSTLITHSDGLTLIKHYLYNKTTTDSTPIYHVKIIPEPPFKFGIYVIVSLVIIGVSFLVLFAFILLKCYLQRRRMQRHRLPRSALKQLKIKKFAKSDHWEVCVICLDDFEVGAKLRILPCDHAYHMKCIDPWLLNNRRQCPVCKRYVFPNMDNSDDEENNDRSRFRISTERTPLVLPNDGGSTTEISTTRQLPLRRPLNPSAGAARNIFLSSTDSSDSTDDLSSSSRPTTTTEIIFNRPSSNSRQYGSTMDSSRTTIAATHRGANVSLDSYDNTTNNRNTSPQSIVEDISDIETIDDNNEHMPAVRITAGENRAYAAEDEQTTTDTFHTHL